MFPLKKEKAFTLVELLVVMAIVVLLAGLLLPALSASKEKGKSAACINRLKQIGSGNISYSTDNDGYFCPYSQYSLRDGIPCPTWFGWFDGTQKNLNKDGYLSDYTASNQELFTCPSFRAFLEEDLSACDDGGGYGYNQYGIGSQYYIGGDKYGVSMKSIMVKIPSKTVMITDCADCDARGSGMTDITGTYMIYPQSQYGFTHFRHTGQSSAVWADGHCNSERPTSLEDTDLAYRYTIGWIGPDDESYYDPAL